MPLPFGSSILSYSLSAKLKHTCIKLIIFSMVCNKCVVVATLYDVAVLKHHYRIGVSYGGKSVTVLPSIRLSMPFSMRASVLVSMEDVASSRIRTGGSATAALAMARSCL